jgi:SnoaL-like domain
VNQKSELMETTAADRLALWVDKLELKELLSILASAVDRADQELITSCYAEESYDDHGTFQGSGREFAEYVCHQDTPADFRMHHLLGQSVFEIRGDEAWGETFFVYHDATDTTTNSGFGRFIDYFQRIDSEWKVKFRRVVADRTTASHDIKTFWKSTTDRNDPLYDHLTWPKG